MGSQLGRLSWDMVVRGLVFRALGLCVCFWIGGFGSRVFLLLASEGP